MDQQFREEVLQRLTKVETLQKASIRLQMNQIQVLTRKVEKHEKAYNWGRGILSAMGVAWMGLLAWIAKHTNVHPWW